MTKIEKDTEYLAGLFAKVAEIKKGLVNANKGTVAHVTKMAIAPLEKRIKFVKLKMANGG